jgi:hypothetical protein
MLLGPKLRGSALAAIETKGWKMKKFMGVLGMIVGANGFAFGQAVSDGYRYLEFPEALPGKVLKVRKVVDAITGKVAIRTSLEGVESDADLRTLESTEERILRSRDGAIDHELAERMRRMDGAEKTTVAIHLKYPPISYPDKTRHSAEELKAASLAAAAVRPLTDFDALSRRYGIPWAQDRGGDILICDLTRSQLEAMKSDGGIGAIEAIREEGPLSPDLSTLSASGYNPGSVPSGSGSGVNAATFETGLTSGFLSCIGVTPASYDTNTTGLSTDIRHANASFRCLAGTAPSANLYHRLSITFNGTDDVNYLINNGIQTVSMSRTRGGTSPSHSTSAEFLVMDDFAYRYPYPVFVNPSANDGYQYEVNWQCYNALSVGNVRHTNNSTYEMADCTQAKNPPPVYGSCISGTGANCAGDREMPYVVVPGIPSSGTDFGTSCLGGSGTVVCGTSWSAPIGNGLAADVIAADSRLVSWPEKVRATLILTAQNVDGGYWSCGTDGRDGSGVVSGSDAVSFAQNHSTVYVGNTAVEKGMGAGSISTSDFSGTRRFNYVVPNPKPSGKHLRVVLTWDSNPVVGGGTNALSDMDLSVQKNGGTQSSYSWDGNVEVVDIAANDLTAGSSYYIDVLPGINRIPASGSRTDYFYYAVAWTWVKDHAD